MRSYQKAPQVGAAGRRTAPPKTLTGVDDQLTSRGSTAPAGLPRPSEQRANVRRANASAKESLRLLRRFPDLKSETKGQYQGLRSPDYFNQDF